MVGEAKLLAQASGGGGELVFFDVGDIVHGGGAGICDGWRFG